MKKGWKKRKMNAPSAASNGKPTVISLFAGCGGSSLGYQFAGFHELLAVEWDDNAVETFRLNFTGVPVYHGDIAKLSGDECMRLARIEKGQLDVLDGSPPCQGFSTAGKRRFNDPRNSLFMEFARLLSELQPKAFVMENVTGMVKGCMKQAYLQIIKTLRECGYRAKGEVLNAMYFNVPQSRERVIIIGVREDLGIEPSYPRPQTRPRTVREAFSGLGDDVSARCVPKPGSKTAAQMADVLPGSTCELHHSHKRLAWNQPAPTLDQGGGAGEWHVWHPSEHRPITTHEAKRLMTFPDDYRFAGTVSDCFTRIGNSVPPNLMRAIAEHIKVNVLEKANARS
ncbi:MAG: DNA cytosine methyltransferase [Desulfobacterales bacterium]|nr:DNA cytosine methyltransferase [Desulfobacterales bacterium]